MNKEKIPEGWERIKLKEVLLEVNERNKGEKVKNVLSVTNSQGFVNQEEYFEGTVHSENISNYKIVRKNQFAYNPSRVNVGSIDILKKYNEGALSPMYIVFKVDEERLLPEYFKYYFETYRFSENVKNNTQGSVRNSLNFTALANFEYLLPSIKEQEKIVRILKILDNCTNKIESKIKMHNIEKQEIFDKFFIKNAKHFSESTFEELIEKGIILEIMDGNHGELHPKTEDYVETGIPFIMANNIHDGILDLTNCNFLSKVQADNLRKGFARTGDILLTHKGTVGNVGYIPENIPTDYVMLTPQVTYYRIKEKNEILTREYLYYFLQSKKFQNALSMLSKQSTRAYIGITAQKKMKISLPSFEEQKKVCKLLWNFDKKIKVLKEKYIGYKSLKQALMQQLLTGKVRVKI